MHSNKRKISAILVACVLAFAFTASGCADAYTESMRASAKLADSITEGTNLVKALYEQKLIDKEEKDGAAEWMISLTKANQTWRGTIAQIHKDNPQPGTGKAEYLTAASALVTAAGDPTTIAVLHVKNPKAQARLQKWTLTAKTILDGVSLAIQKAKGN